MKEDYTNINKLNPKLKQICKSIPRYIYFNNHLDGEK